MKNNENKTFFFLPSLWSSLLCWEFVHPEWTEAEQQLLPFYFMPGFYITLDYTKLSIHTFLQAVLGPQAP